MTPATPDAELTPDLIERVRKLSTESKDKLVVLLLDELDGPPDNRTEEEIAAEIKRRSDDYHGGIVKLLTPEEVERNVREVLRRRYGYEL